MPLDRKHHMKLIKLDEAKTPIYRFFTTGGCLVREENRILILYKNVKITKRIKKNQGLKSVCNK